MHKGLNVTLTLRTLTLIGGDASDPLRPAARRRGSVPFIPTSNDSGEKTAVQRNSSSLEDAPLPTEAEEPLLNYLDFVLNYLELS